MSTNNGTSWTRADSGVDYSWGGGINKIRAIGTFLVAIGWSNRTYCNVLYTSADSAASWTPLLSLFWIRDVGVSGSSIFVAVSGWPHGTGILRSRDGGVTWDTVNTGLTDKSVLSLEVTETHLFAGTESGVFVSSNSGESWTAANSGLVGSQINAMAFQGSSLFAATGYGVSRSLDGGASWTYVNSGLPIGVVFTVATLGNCIYLGGYNPGLYQDGALFYSTDQGSSWVPRNSGISGFESVPALLLTDTCFVAGGSRVFISTNGGESWLPRSNGLTMSYVSCLLSRGTYLFAGSDAGIFRSSNMGSSWEAATVGLFYPGTRTLGACGSILLAGTTNGGVYRSTNNGASWSAANTGLTDLEMLSFAEYHENIFLGTRRGGVFRSTDGGMSWRANNEGLTTLAVSSLAVRDEYLYAGTVFNGMWKRPLAEMITDVASERELPSEFSLEQNYPNPFNPSTTIEYALARSGPVSLEVVNLLGGTVAVLAAGDLPAGRYHATWDAAGSPSGMYFCIFRAGAFRAVRKIILMK